MKKRYVIIIPTIMFIVLFTLTNYYHNKRERREFELFNTTPISGKLVQIDFAHKKDAFKTNNSKEVFYFQSGLNYMPEQTHSFYRVAEIGDSVYKDAFSDTLFLFKMNGEKYMYSFHQY